MRKVTRRLLMGLALIFAFLLFWQKLHIVVIVRAGLWQLLGLFGVLAVAIYLVLEVLF